MIKQMAWNIFKNTGNIDSFLEFKQVKEIEDKIIGEADGNNKNQGDCDIRK